MGLTWGNRLVFEHMFEYDRIMDPDRLTTPTALLARVVDVHRTRTEAEAELLALACAWADAHPDLNQRPAVPALGPDWFPDDNQPILGDDPADEDLLIPASPGTPRPRSPPRWGCPPRPGRV